MIHLQNVLVRHPLFTKFKTYCSKLVSKIFYPSGCLLWSDFQNLLNENFFDHSFCLDQDLLGSLQVHLPSRASEGQFVPSLHTFPSQGTMVVYTGSGDGVTNKSEIRQTPSETHAREDSC